jgi:hypothetical protein
VGNSASYPELPVQDGTFHSIKTAYHMTIMLAWKDSALAFSQEKDDVSTEVAFWLIGANAPIIQNN